MSLTRTQIDSWNPATLTEIGDAWIALGTKVEDLFTRYVDGVTKVNDTYWEAKPPRPPRTGRMPTRRRRLSWSINWKHSPTVRSRFPRRRRTLAACADGDRGRRVCGFPRSRRPDGHRSRDPRSRQRSRERHDRMATRHRRRRVGDGNCRRNRQGRTRFRSRRAPGNVHLRRGAGLRSGCVRRYATRLRPRRIESRAGPETDRGRGTYPRAARRRELRQRRDDPCVADGVPESGQPVTGRKESTGDPADHGQATSGLCACPGELASNRVERQDHGHHQGRLAGADDRRPEPATR